MPHWFKDPLGHEFEIAAEQSVGDAVIVCPICGWRGTTLDGGAEVLSSTELESELEVEDKE